MLSFAGKVCMRNADLTAAWFGGAVGPDLGLDALDILDIEKQPIIAFSTEVDDPKLRFTSGDLLFTPGYAIPNVALVKPFNINWDIGLDGVQFIGTIVNILNFVSSLSDYPRDKFLQDPGLLQTLLNQNKIDIWFTVEGTAAIGTHGQVLDGDLLSAATGTIIVSQAALLPANVPAGLPVTRGGLRAGWRYDPTRPRSGAHGTPLLDRNPVRRGNLLHGRGHPAPGRRHRDDELGSDPAVPPGRRLPGAGCALVRPRRPPVDPKMPNIQKLCGAERSVGEFNGGMAPINGGGTGLYQGPSGDFNGPTNDPTTHDPRGQPCGNFVPVDGFVPRNAGVDRFRVAYRLSTQLAPSTVDDPLTPGIRTKWRLNVRIGSGSGSYCATYNSALYLSTDPHGWMDANDWFAAKDGENVNTSTGIVDHCVNSHLLMAVWDTNNSQGLGWNPPDKDGHYVLWLEWIDTDGTQHREPVEHHLQLDNTGPTIAAYPDGLQVYVNNPNNTQGALVPVCGNETTGANEFQIWGRFYDAYYSRFSLQVSGGNPWTIANYGPHKWWDSNDGTVIPLPSRTPTRRVPPRSTTTVHLRNIDLALPPPTAWAPPSCIAATRFRCEVWDASILHWFWNNVSVSDAGHHCATNGHHLLRWAVMS